MSGDIYMAAAGALATERKLDLIANNLANVNTAGFKRDIGQFKFAEPQDPNIGEPSPTASIPELAAEAFWTEFRSVTDFSGGKFKQTGNTLDVAISGNGFFSVQTDEGIRYTRSGDFTLNADGVLSTKDGFAVMGTGGEIRIPLTIANGESNGVAIDSEGGITVGSTKVGQLQVVDFDDRAQLLKVGNTLFASPEAGAAAIEAEDFSINQGFIELSNVDSVKMMTEMIEVLRGYEAYQKIIQSIDKINQSAIKEVAG